MIDARPVKRDLRHPVQFNTKREAEEHIKSKGCFLGVGPFKNIVYKKTEHGIQKVGRLK